MSCEAGPPGAQRCRGRALALARRSRPSVLKVLSLPRLCNPVFSSSKKRVFSSPLALHFHSDESLTHKGFYLIYRAFSPEGSK